MKIKTFKRLASSVLVSVSILSGAMPLQAQEVLSGIQTNQAQAVAHAKSIRAAATDAPLEIPFFDDFSTSKVIPDQSKWVNQFVFVNNDFAIFPPNIGVATLDVLNENGEVYPTASSTPFVGDYLQSKRIRLDSIPAENRELSPADSVYLSFYFQPQGRGDKPESYDTLVLQVGYPSGLLELDYIDSVWVFADDYLIANNIDTIFPLDTIYSPFGCNQELYLISNQIYTWGDQIQLPCDSVFKPALTWKTLWYTEGSSLNNFVDSTGKYFQQVLVPITDTLFFTDNFNFRFFNYGSIADNVLPSNRSNVDQWNIDFVYLNAGRSATDTTYAKLSFSERAPSFLKRYQSMPYKQYRSDPTNAISPEFQMFITNLDAVTHNTKYRYEVTQNNGNQQFSYDGGNCSLAPFSEVGFQTCSSGCGAAQACPPVASLFSLDFDRDSTSYLIRHYISDSTQTNILVDSVFYKQGFYNYFAYDDGTPELGYGLEPAGAYMAVQFKMTVPDTLQGVQMFFNQTLANTNYKFFDIVIWRDNNGKPGEEMYRLEHQRPQWENGLYAFHFYPFSDPLVVNGTFYVGIMQVEMGSMNLGFDAANDNSSYNFFNVDGTWQNSLYPGSLMIRPVVGSDYYIGNPELNSDTKFDFTVYPNPANQFVKLSISGVNDPSACQVSIYTLTGQEVFRSSLPETINTSHFNHGLYLIRCSAPDGSTVVKKLLISN